MLPRTRAKSTQTTTTVTMLVRDPSIHPPLIFHITGPYHVIPDETRTELGRVLFCHDGKHLKCHHPASMSTPTRRRRLGCHQHRHFGGSFGLVELKKRNWTQLNRTTDYFIRSSRSNCSRIVLRNEKTLLRMTTLPTEFSPCLV